jgi:hypothetical protein
MPLDDSDFHAGPREPDCKRRSGLSCADDYRIKTLGHVNLLLGRLLLPISKTFDLRPSTGCPRARFRIQAWEKACAPAGKLALTGATVQI